METKMNARTLAQRRVVQPGIADYVASAFTAVYDAYVRMAEEARKRRDRDHLYAMPDYLLKDIGVSRSEIDRAITFGRDHDGSGKTGAMRRGPAA